MSTVKIGFIGLGIMGRPMALNLLRQGVTLLVNDIDIQAQETLRAEGALPCSLGEIGQQCEIVFTILPDGQAVRDVLFGESSVVLDMPPGRLVVDMSSVTAEDSRGCFERLAQQSIGFLDAPVSGGEPGAIEGTLSFMVGGRQEDFERALPYFSIMGSSAVYIATAMDRRMPSALLLWLSLSLFLSPRRKRITALSSGPMGSNLGGGKPSFS